MMLQKQLQPSGLRGGCLPSRRPALQVQAKLKIAQNHKSSSVFIKLDHDKLYTDSSFLPARQFGPVKLASIPGQGRGLLATSQLQPGDLLVVSEPAGPVARAPEGQLMAQQLLLGVMQGGSTLSTNDRHRLRLLFDGQAKGISQQQLDVASFIEDPAKKKKKAAQQPSKGFGAANAPPPEPTPDLDLTAEFTAEQLQPIVMHNFWAQEYADLGAAGSRGEQSHAYLGVWPEHALLNHSCVPNTVSLIVGNRLLARAARPMNKGAHVTTNYLGYESAAPVSVRRQRLQEMYGFQCDCPRCKFESSQPEAVTSLLQEMHTWISQKSVTDTVRTQIATSDPALQQLAPQLQGFIDRLEALMEQQGLNVQDKLWLKASAYGCYELLAIIRMEAIQLEHKQSSAAESKPAGEIAGRAAKISEDLIPVVNVFAPASDMYLYLALEWLTILGDGRLTTETDAAARTLLAGTLIRYGRVSDAVLQRVMQARGKVDYHMGRISLPTPWAAA